MVDVQSVIEQIATTLGRPAPASDSTEYRQWALWVADGDALIADGLARRSIAPADVSDEARAYVLREMVAERVKRPDSATTVTAAVDDASISRRYETGTGQLTIRPEWWERLTPLGTDGAGAFSTRTTGEPDVLEPETLWLGWSAT